MMDKKLCSCGKQWKIQDNLSTYEGEIVLVCLSCGRRFYNAQEFFELKDLSGLEHVQIKGHDSATIDPKDECNHAWSDAYSVDELLGMIKTHRHALQPGQLVEACDKISSEISTLHSERDAWKAKAAELLKILDALAGGPVIARDEAVKIINTTRAALEGKP